MDHIRALIIFLSSLLPLSALSAQCYQVGTHVSADPAAACAAYGGDFGGSITVNSSSIVHNGATCALFGSSVNVSTGYTQTWSHTRPVVGAACPDPEPEPEPEPPVNSCPAAGTEAAFTLNWKGNTGLRCLGGCGFMGNTAGHGTDSNGDPTTYLAGSYTGSTCNEPDDSIDDAPIDDGEGDGGTGEGEGGEDGPPPNPGACYDMHGFETPCVPVEGGDTGGGDGDGGGDDSGGGTGEVGTGGDGEDTGGTGPGGSGDGGGSGDNGDGDGTGGTGDGGDGTGGNGSGDDGGTGSGGGSTGDPDGKPDGSSFGGSCKAGFVCTGDPVACAIAKRQHTLACELTEPAKDLEQVFTDAQKEDQGSGIWSGREETVGGGSGGIGSIDTSSAIGAGSCMPDFVISAGRWSQVVSFAPMCPRLKVIGNLLVFIALLAAARIVGTALGGGTSG